MYKELIAQLRTYAEDEQDQMKKQDLWEAADALETRFTIRTSLEELTMKEAIDRLERYYILLSKEPVKYAFEKRIEQNPWNITVINARRFANRVSQARERLENAGKGYGIESEDYYNETITYLKQMEERLLGGLGGTQ